jgi:VCBS repeat-containing protein
MTLSLTMKGFDYPAFINGSYADNDSLSALDQTGANSIEVSLDYGIDANTDTVVQDSNYTDTLTDLGATIKQAVGMGLSVMVRPLIDFVDPSELTNGPYAVGDWRAWYNPGAANSAGANAFFASYQSLLLAEATVAVANGATSFCIGTELDQITGPAYKHYWDSIITALRTDDPTLKLTYSAIWDDASSPWTNSGLNNGLAAGTGNLLTQVSFASELDFLGIDEYAPISNSSDPTLQQLIDGWTQTPVDSGATGSTYAVTGNQSLISYYEGLASTLGKPIVFTELGYENTTDADSSPFATQTNGSVLDDNLQSELYQAFFDAWEQSGNSSLKGVYSWYWDPKVSEVGPGTGVNFSPQGLPALTPIESGFAASSPNLNIVAETGTASASGPQGGPDFAIGTAGTSGTGLLAGDSTTDSSTLSVKSINGVAVTSQADQVIQTEFGTITLNYGTGANSSGAYRYSFGGGSNSAPQPTGAPVVDVIPIVVTSTDGETENTTLTITDYRRPTVVSESATANEDQLITRTAGTSGTGALAGDSDPDGVALSVSVSNGLLQYGPVITTQYGTLTLNSDGSYTYQADSQVALAADFAADAGAPLVDSFFLYPTGGDGAFNASSLGITIYDSNSFTGGGETINFGAQAGNVAYIYDTAGDWDTVDGSEGTVGLTDAQTSVIGGGDTVDFNGASGNVATLENTDNAWDAVYGSNGTVYLISAQTAVIGGDDTVNFYSGSGNVATLENTDNAWDSVYGANGTVYLISAQSAVIGGGDTVDFYSGSGNVATLEITDNAWDSVYGANGTVYLISAQSAVIGGGDTVNFYSGSGNVATLENTNNAWDSVYGYSGAIYLVSAQAAVIGGGDTVNFYSGSGNVATLESTNNAWDAVYGSSGTVYLISAQAAVIGGGDMVDFYSGSGNAASLTGTDYAIVFNQASFGLDTISGYQSADALSFAIGDQGHLTVTQSGANTLITLDPADIITLTNVLASNLGQISYHT